MASTTKLDKVQLKGHRPRRTAPSGMLNAFIYGEQGVMDFISLRRDGDAQTAGQEPSTQDVERGSGHITEQHAKVAELMKMMDEMTDAKTLQDACANETADDGSRGMVGS